MKKYKFFKKEEYKDQAYKLTEKYNLNDKEKEEVNILISKYSLLLQKINQSIENNKFELIKKEILEKLKE
jgi:hypothetical protein